MKFPRCNRAKWENHPQGTSVVIHVGMFTCKTSLTHKVHSQVNAAVVKQKSQI